MRISAANMRQLPGDTRLFRYAAAAIAALIGVAVFALAYDARPRSESAERRFTAAITTDHRIGSEAAPVQLIVYTDTECPYCKKFHRTTIPFLLERYGSDIAIVYRAFPLPRYDRSYAESLAAECAAVVGGETAYWKFIDALFAITPSENRLDPAALDRIARGIGLDPREFQSCRENDQRVRQRMADQKTAALAAGISITPSIVVVGSEGEFLVEGNYYSQIVAAIEYLRRASRK